MYITVLPLLFSKRESEELSQIDVAKPDSQKILAAGAVTGDITK